jgi:hypothetical protein
VHDRRVRPPERERQLHLLEHDLRPGSPRLEDLEREAVWRSRA